MKAASAQHFINKKRVHEGHTAILATESKHLAKVNIDLLVGKYSSSG